jgi:hypothetical protein
MQITCTAGAGEKRLKPVMQITCTAGAGEKRLKPVMQITCTAGAGEKRLFASRLIHPPYDHHNH